MLDWLIPQIGFIALFAACALAWTKGGPAERSGAILIAVVWLAEASALFVTHGVRPAWALACDFIQAVGFLVLALRYSSGWLGVAMLLQSAALTLHALELTDIGIPRWVYILGIDILSGCILMLIVAATALAWRKRVKERTRAGSATGMHPSPTPAA